MSFLTVNRGACAQCGRTMSWPVSEPKQLCVCCDTMNAWLRWFAKKQPLVCIASDNPRPVARQEAA